VGAVWHLSQTGTVCTPGLFLLFSTCVAPAFSTSWGLIVCGSMVVVPLLPTGPPLLGSHWAYIRFPSFDDSISVSSVPEPAINLL